MRDPDDFFKNTFSASTLWNFMEKLFLISLLVLNTTTRQHSIMLLYGDIIGI